MKNDNEIKINIDSAIALANLSIDAKKDYLSFVNDFIYYINIINRKNAIFNKSYKCNFDVDDFLELCQKKICDSKDIKIKSPLRLYYASLINNHKVFLKEILKDRSDFARLYYSGVLTDIKLNERFIDYLDSIADFDLIVKNNLEKIKTIGISKITLKEGTNLDGNYAMSVINNPNKFEDGNTRYMIIGTLSDGNIVNEDKLDDSTYTYDVKGASYIIRFTKGTLCNDETDMVLNSLIFDSNSLPSKGVLSDATILPDFDFKRIDLQCKAVDMLYLYDNIANLSKELNKGVNELLQFLKDNDCNMQYLELLMHSTDCQVLSRILEGRKEESLLELSKCVSSDTAKKLIMKRRDTIKNREQYL